MLFKKENYLFSRLLIYFFFLFLFRLSFIFLFLSYKNQFPPSLQPGILCIFSLFSYSAIGPTIYILCKGLLAMCNPFPSEILRRFSFSVQLQSHQPTITYLRNFSHLTHWIIFSFLSLLIVTPNDHNLALHSRLLLIWFWRQKKDTLLQLEKK